MKPHGCPAKTQIPQRCSPISLHSTREDSLGPSSMLHKERQTNVLIRLAAAQADLSYIYPGAHMSLLVLSCSGSFELAMLSLRMVGFIK